MGSMRSSFHWLFDGRRFPPVNKDDRVLDLGAHIGGFVIPAAATGAHVTAIEPVPANVELLRQNVHTAQVDNNVSIIEAAATRRMGICPFRVSSFASTNGSIIGVMKHSIYVKTVDWRELLSSLIPTIIKMDIEGAEWMLLPQVLPSSCRAIDIEFHFQKLPATRFSPTNRFFNILKHLKQQGFVPIQKERSRQSKGWSGKLTMFRTNKET